MSDVQQTDFYQVMGLRPKATLDDINLAYIRWIQHFDNPKVRQAARSGEISLREQIEQVQEAYNTLSDPEKRLAYNRTMNLPNPPEVQETLEVLRQAKERVYVEVERTLQKKKSRNSIYLDFFGFREKPFDLTPDPKYLYLSPKHKEVLAHLVFGLQENNGFLKIIGEVGTGKTTICRSFLKELREDFNFAYIFHPCVNSLELLQSINAEFDIPSESRSKKTLIQHLNRFLVEQRKAGNRVAVIIDEAQDLQPAVLEELRLLSNLETETEKLIQIVLIGQPELDKLLSKPELRQLRQRITIQWELLPLNKEEARGYIQHRLNVARGKGKVRLGPQASDWIYKYTQGIPRMINVVADRALLIAYTQGTKRITPKIIKQAAKDVGGLQMKQGPWRLVGKVLLPALLAAALVVGALHYLVDLNFSPHPPQADDLKNLIRENPLKAPDQSLIPQVPAKTETAPATVTPGSVAAPGATALAKPLEPAQPELLRISKTNKLVTYLSSLSLAESKVEAVQWILKSWGVDKQERLQYRNPELQDLEEEFGFYIYQLNGNLKRLATLNYPALLEITLPNSEGTKYIALNSLKGDSGIFGSVDQLEIPLETIAPLWNHRALVLWKDFEDLPYLMENGFKGKEAIWLQKNLRLLGFYKGREAASFGPKTEQAVKRYQRQYNIKDDGRFDTESKLMLYNLLNIYPTPKLVKR